MQETKRAYVTPSSVQPLHTCVWDGDFTEAYKPPFLPLAALRSFVMEQVIAYVSPISPLYLHCISPTSPLHLHYISPTSRAARLPGAPRRAARARALHVDA